jgi:hypothetical protein
MEFAMKAVGFDAFHGFAGRLEFGFALEGNARPDCDCGDVILPLDVLKQAFSFAFISDRIRCWACASVRKVSIMHVLSEPTSSSSGAQMLGSPLNSGGLPTTMFGLPAAESIPRRAELQVVLAS